MNAIKKAVAYLLTTALLISGFAFAIPFSASAAYDNSNTYTITGFDTTPPSTSGHSGIYVFPNTSSSARVINASDYTFRYSKLMIFNGDGRIIECGGEVFPNSTTVTGSPQLTLTVPAGGFLLAFGSGVSGLMSAHTVAMEGAMLYNSTMTVNYEIKGSYNKTTKKLTIEYNNPKTPSASAKKFLFVGNSTTYFNGSPIKFKGMAAAAGIELDVVYSTMGSAYLSYFAEPTHNAGKLFREKLALKSYDYVVLQDAGKATYSNSKPAMEILMPLIEANGAEAALYKRYASETNYEERLVHAEIHNYNYNRLAKEYGIDMNAPVADAFLFVDENYPQINLYADDNAHHSAAGSYLIALVWAITYLGIDITNNDYTANLPAETVSILKECAIKACKEGYPYKPYEDGGVFVEGDKVYDNVALNKTYTSNGAEYHDSANERTDHNDDGTIIGKLTDGITAASGSDAATGCHKGASVDYTIDLDGTYLLKAFKVPLYGGTWGIPDPANITISVAVSTDGTNFTNVGTLTKSEETVSGDWKFRDNKLILDNYVAADYVRFTATNSGGTSTFMWLSELFVYGEALDDAENVFVDNGKIYDNVALNKTYTSNGAEYHDESDLRTDHNADGTIIGKLTDGIVATTGSDSATGCHKGASVDYTIDLGGFYALKAFRAPLFGGTWGITDPANITISVAVSNDGTNFTNVGTLTQSEESVSGNWKFRDNMLVLENTVNAKQVRFTASYSENTITWIWLSELFVFGTRDNLTLGNSYQSTLAPSATYTDANNSELTDGVILTDSNIIAPYYNDSRWVGYCLTSKLREFELVMPLGDGETASELYSVEIVVGGDKCTSGVSEPDFTVYYTADGTEWKELGSYIRTGADHFAIKVTIGSDIPVVAKQIKFKFTNSVGKNLVWISEITAYGAAHSCTYGNQWASDDNQHWNECDCGNKANATAHDDGKWTTVSEPEIGIEGLRELRCTVCGHLLETETIPAIEDPNMLKGDIDGDKDVDATDYLLVKRYCFNTITLDESQKQRADLNSSGTIDASDYVLVKRIAFGVYIA